MNLSEEEQELVREILASMDDTTVNVMALDRKYDKQWYAEQVQHLREMDEYFKEVGQVMGMRDTRTSDQMERVCDQRRDSIQEVMSIYQDALTSMRDNEHEQTLH